MERIRLTFKHWEKLKRKYPLFKRRLLFDAEYKKWVTKWFKDGFEISFLERIVRSAGQLSPLMTHSLKCKYTGLLIFDRWEIPCPLQNTTLENCLDSCIHIEFKRKSEFIIPEGFGLDSSLEHRIVLAKPMQVICDEALEQFVEQHGDIDDDDEDLVSVIFEEALDRAYDESRLSGHR